MTTRCSVAWSMNSDDDALLGGVVEALRERAKTLKEMAGSSLFFFREPVMDEKAVAKNLTRKRRSCWES